MAAASAAASGIRPLLFRPVRWDRRFRLASAPGSALSHLCPPPEGRTSGRSSGRPLLGGAEAGWGSSGRALLRPPTAFPFRRS